VTAEGDDAFVADIRGVQESTTLKVFSRRRRAAFHRP
jgi:hypothetical protein